jgi:hypothetical protein
MWGQEAPVQLSRDRKTELVCLQEFLKRLQDRHVDCAEAVAKKAASDAASATTVSPDTPSVLQAMMQLRQAKSRAEAANKPWRRRRRKGMLLKKQWKN